MISTVLIYIYIYIVKIDSYLPQLMFQGVSINKEYLSLVSLSTDPPQVCHGNGATIAASRNQAALRALRTLSKLGLDNASNAAQVKKDKGASGDGIHISIQVKNNMDGAIDK